MFTLQGNARVLKLYEESMVRSDDTHTLKWLRLLYSHMFNKGRGISRMISDFIVCHQLMTIILTKRMDESCS